MMRSIRRLRTGLLMVGLICWGAFVGAVPAIAVGTEVLDPEMEYRVTYATSQSDSTTMQFVRILGVVMIGSKEFLMVGQSGYKTKSFVALDAVRAIIPSKL